MASGGLECCLLGRVGDLKLMRFQGAESPEDKPVRLKLRSQITKSSDHIFPLPTFSGVSHQISPGTNKKKPTAKDIPTKHAQ